MSVLFSLGVVGFAITFALQGALASLIGWLYIVTKRPYGVGDRIAIEDTRGDVAAIDLFVTEVWEIDGDLVSSNQPSGRIITVPNSVVLSAHVVNFHGEGVPHVWNELSVQVTYETDLDFAADVMIAAAVDHLGDEMAAGVAEYRERLAETPVELDVNDSRRSTSSRRSRGSNSACAISSTRAVGRGRATRCPRICSAASTTRPTGWRFQSVAAADVRWTASFRRIMRRGIPVGEYVRRSPAARAARPLAPDGRPPTDGAGRRSV